MEGKIRLFCSKISKPCSVCASAFFLPAAPNSVNLNQKDSNGFPFCRFLNLFCRYLVELLSFGIRLFVRPLLTSDNSTCTEKLIFWEVQQSQWVVCYRRFG